MENITENKTRKYYNIIKFKNGNRYMGTCERKKPSGKGILISKSLKVIYKGEYKFGQKHGYGQKYNNDNTYYIGDFKNNKKNGRGCMYNNLNKLIYYGNWENNKKHGSGHLILFENKIWISGIFEMGKIKKCVLVIQNLFLPFLFPDYFTIKKSKKIMTKICINSNFENSYKTIKIYAGMAGLSHKFNNLQISLSSLDSIYKIEEINKNSYEFHLIQAYMIPFEISTSWCEVISIERVINPTLYNKFMMYSEHLKKSINCEYKKDKYNPNYNERWAFHGFKINKNLEQILTEGFMCEYSKENLYGYGTYFSTSIHIAHNYASKDLYGENIYTVILGRIALGESILGEKNATRKMITSSYYNHSFVNKFETIMSIPNNNGMYPAYIIRYKYHQDQRPNEFIHPDNYLLNIKSVNIDEINKIEEEGRTYFKKENIINKYIDYFKEKLKN